LRLRDSLVRELVFRGVHYRSFCYFVRAGAGREGHEIRLVTVIRGRYGEVRQDRDRGLGMREKEKKDKGEGGGRDKGEKGLRV